MLTCAVLAYTLKTTVTPTNCLAAQKYLAKWCHWIAKFALAWALLSYTNSVGYSTATLQPTVAFAKRQEKRLKPPYLFSLISAKR